MMMIIVIGISMTCDDGYVKNLVMATMMIIVIMISMTSVNIVIMIIMTMAMMMRTCPTMWPTSLMVSTASLPGPGGKETTKAFASI